MDCSGTGLSCSPGRLNGPFAQWARLTSQTSDGHLPGHCCFMLHLLRPRLLLTFAAASSSLSSASFARAPQLQSCATSTAARSAGEERSMAYAVVFMHGLGDVGSSWRFLKQHVRCGCERGRRRRERGRGKKGGREGGREGGRKKAGLFFVFLRV